MKYATSWALSLICLGLATTGCDESKKEELAPQASALVEEEPKAQSTTYSIDTKQTQVEFRMDAELEAITGRAPESAEGQLHVDLSDLTKTTGLVKVDLLDLSVYQKKRESADDKFGEEVKNEKQNEHMRTWFQISDDAPPEVRDQNRYAEFSIEKVAGVKNPNVLAMSGDTRTVTADVTGDFRLHGRVTQQTLKLEITFTFAEGKPARLSLKTREPFEVHLEKHDVKPRSTFDKLAEKTLDALGAKVAKVAKVDLQATAIAQGSVASAKPQAPPTP